MSEEPKTLDGPDLAQGVAITRIANGAMLLGHADGEPVLLARRGDELFAIGAVCSHYGGPLEQRARFLLEVVAAIRAEVGHDFHLQVKISAEDHNDALSNDEAPGNTLADTTVVAGRPARAQ